MDFHILLKLETVVRKLKDRIAFAKVAYILMYGNTWRCDVATAP